MVRCCAEACLILLAVLQSYSLPACLDKGIRGFHSLARHSPASPTRSHLFTLPFVSFSPIYPPACPHRARLADAATGGLQAKSSLRALALHLTSAATSLTAPAHPFV
jgi:hypothetical protein